MNLYTNTAVCRLIMAPLAIVVMLVVWWLFDWKAGLFGGMMVLLVAPELLVIFSKRWRALKAMEEDEQRQRERRLFDELDRKYPNESSDPIEEPEYIDKIDEEIFGI